MKHEFNINYKGEDKKVVIEPAQYQGKQIFEIAYDRQFIVVYREGEGWHQDGDHDYDGEWLTAIGNLVDSLPKVEYNNVA